MNDKGYAVIAENYEPVRNIIVDVINYVYKGEIKGFPDGEGALDFCLKHPDDVRLLLTEWEMPESIGGRGLIEGLRDKDITSIYPDRIIIASSNIIWEGGKINKEYGIKHLIVKPIDINKKLIPAVKKVLELE